MLSKDGLAKRVDFAKPYHLPVGPDFLACECPAADAGEEVKVSHMFILMISWVASLGRQE